MQSSENGSPVCLTSLPLTTRSESVGYRRFTLFKKASLEVMGYTTLPFPLKRVVKQAEGAMGCSTTPFPENPQLVSQTLRSSLVCSITSLPLTSE